jgi:glycosyltransferase involved in cell wall biosynthesis
MKLAFVIPAYNEEALIGKCLESVLAEIKRSGVNAEVIVVNNASKDRTGEIARSFAQEGSRQCARRRLCRQRRL